VFHHCLPLGPIVGVPVYRNGRADPLEPANALTHSRIRSTHDPVRSTTNPSAPLRRPSTYLSCVSVRSRGRILLLDLATVDWIEAADNYVQLHVGRHQFLLRETLFAFEKQLDPARFARIHRSGWCSSIGSVSCTQRVTVTWMLC
jgi:DNA-binding LytR/AlgR family response regulator